MWYFKKKNEADKEAVKKISKEVSKRIVGQVKAYMKKQVINASVIKTKKEYTSLRYYKPNGIWAYIYIEPMDLHRGDIITITIEKDENRD